MAISSRFNLKEVTLKDFNSFSAYSLSIIISMLVRKQGNVSIALSGGSTPLPVLSILKSYNLEWDKITFYMVDERAVESSSKWSNYGNISDILFKYVKSSSYPMYVENYSPLECSSMYEKLIRSKLPSGKNKFPVFDLILLGYGQDGHTASLFRGDKATVESEKAVTHTHVAQLKSERITLTFPVILNALKIVILAKGVEKRKILDKILNGHGNQYPIAKVINAGKDVTCVLGL